MATKVKTATEYTSSMEERLAMLRLRSQREKDEAHINRVLASILLAVSAALIILFMPSIQDGTLFKNAFIF